MSDKPKPGDPDFELPRKPIPEGLEHNEAFREYRSLSRKQREELKTSGVEMPDLSRLADKDAQIDALKEVVRSQLDRIVDQQRQVEIFKSALHHISDTLTAMAKGKIPPADALKRLVEIVLKIQGVDPRQTPESPTDVH